MIGTFYLIKKIFLDIPKSILIRHSMNIPSSVSNAYEIEANK